MMLVKCNTCGETKEVQIAPSGIQILPQGWKQTTAIVQNVAAPRAAVHECGKLECRLSWHKPPDDAKGEGSWAMSANR